ncbi:hypothetical protein AAEO50_07375 [Rossellomorea oryzaecorticis]|uniref:Holliday junction resolvase RuvC n=1 Tax=Rossellomorea oryzaecorticis TaxID=1396505 RepID=A0ABU9K9I3_9BACI
MLLLALDPSLSIVGYSIYYVDKNECSLLTFGKFKLDHKLEYFDRILTIEGYLNKILNSNREITHLIVEDIQYQKKIGVAVYKKLSFLQFFLRYYSLCNNLESEFVQVNSWRSAVGHFCDLSKNNKIIWNKYVNSQINHVSELDNNVSDAIGIGLWKCLHSPYKLSSSESFQTIINKKQL